MALRTYHGVYSVRTTSIPLTWSLIEEWEGCRPKEWLFYDSDKCVFISKENEIPTYVTNISILPHLFYIKQPSNDIIEIINRFKEIGFDMNEKKVNDETYIFLGKMIGLHPKWIQEIHEFYLKEGVSDIPVLNILT